MTSSAAKSAFSAAGLRVRVRDLDVKLRICPVDGLPLDKQATLAVALSLGLTGPTGAPGGLFNGSAEFIGYKPGRVVRV